VHGALSRLKISLSHILGISGGFDVISIKKYVTLQ
jgi:hypothetical protein